MKCLGTGQGLGQQRSCSQSAWVEDRCVLGSSKDAALSGHGEGQWNDKDELMKTKRCNH